MISMMLEYSGENLLRDYEIGAKSVICPVAFVRPNHIRDIINSIKPKLSSDFDNIPNTSLKKITMKSNCLPNTHFQCMYQIWLFPSAWKPAKVIPILKPQKPTHVANSYRFLRKANQPGFFR